MKKVLVSTLLLIELVFCVSLSSGNLVLDSQQYRDIPWLTALNSKALLDAAFNSKDQAFLCGDVILGFDLEAKNSGPMPVMSTPEKRTSDISLSKWIATVIQRWDGRKKVHLRFWTEEVLEPAFAILKDKRKEMKFELWLEASIVVGPSGTTENLVDGKIFFSLTRKLPKANLALSWTTSKNASLRNSTHYSWENMRIMANQIRCYVKVMENYGEHEIYRDDEEVISVYNPKISFVANAGFVPGSLNELRWLLEVFENSSLTVTSSVEEDENENDLAVIRTYFFNYKVYYCITRESDELIKFKSLDYHNHTAQKDDRLKNVHRPVEFLFWPKRYLDHSPISCLLSYYGTSDTVLVNGGDTVFVLIKQRYKAPAKISGTLVLEDLPCGGDIKSDNSVGTFALLAYESKKLLSKIELTTTDKLWRLYSKTRKIEYTLTCDHSNTTSLHFVLNIGPTPECSYIRNLTETNSTKQDCIKIVPYFGQYVVFGMMFEGRKPQVFQNISITGNLMESISPELRDMPGSILTFFLFAVMFTFYLRK